MSDDKKAAFRWENHFESVMRTINEKDSAMIQFDSTPWGDGAERLSDLFNRCADAPRPPPEPMFYCTVAQYEDARRWLSLPTEERATTNPPWVAIMLGWDT